VRWVAESKALKQELRDKLLRREQKAGTETKRLKSALGIRVVYIKKEFTKYSLPAKR
jgi:hypothetical protein